MANYIINGTPIDYNYYEGVIQAARSEVTATPTSADRIYHETTGTITLDTDMLTGAALGAGTPFDHFGWNFYVNRGTWLLEGRNVQHIEVTSESGTEPTRGDTITFSGGETGEFMRFHTIDGIKYMKLRSLTGSVSSAETMTDPGTYAATANGDSHAGTLEFAQTDEAIASEFDPSHCTIQARGEWFYLRNSSGDVWTSAGSTDSETVEHYSEDHVNALFVETGNGTDVWEIWFNKCATNFNRWQEGPASRVFHKDRGSTTITFGTTANGNSRLVSGARIRVPNLHFGCVNAAQTDWDTETHTHLLPSSVNFDIDKLELGTLGLFTSDAFHGTEVQNTVTNSTYTVSSSEGTGTWQNAECNFDIKISNCGTTTAIQGDSIGSGNIYFNQSVVGTAIFEVENSLMAALNDGNFMSGTTPGLMTITITNSEFPINVTSGSNPPGFTANWGGLYTVDGMTVYGEFNIFNVSPQSSFKNITFYSHSISTAITQTNHNGLMANNITDTVFEGFVVGDNTKPQRMVYDTNYTNGCKFLNAGGGDWDNVEDWSDISFSNLDDLGMSYRGVENGLIAGIAVKGDGDNCAVGVTGCTNTVFQNCRFQGDESTEGYTGLVVTYNKGTYFRSCRVGEGTIFNSSGDNGGVYAWDGPNLTFMISDFFSSDTTGYILMTFDNDAHADYSGAPSALTSSDGRVTILTQNEYIVYTSQLILGHTSFSTDAIRVHHERGNSAIGNTADHYDWEYDIDTGSGFSGTYQSLDMDGTSESNLTTETISPSTGFKIRIRITRNDAAADEQFLDTMVIYTDTTLADQRDNIHPVNLVDITMQNLEANTTYRIYNDTDATEVDTGTISGAGDTTKQYELASGKTLSFRIGGEQNILYTGSLVTTSTGGSIFVSQVDDNFRTVSNATALAYTGITVVGDTSITISGTRTIQEVYEYLMSWQQQSGNLQYAVPISTADGVNFIINTTDYTWSVTGSVTGLSDEFSGFDATMVGTGGFFEDVSGAIWESGGSKYYGSHFYVNVKDNISNANIPDAIVAFVETDTDTDQTYNTSLTNGGIVTDASGDAEGYIVYRVDATTYAGHKQLVGEYDYDWSSIPLATSGAPRTANVRLNTDSNVVDSKATALTTAGITVAQASTTVDLSDETNQKAHDNLKARQARAADIETGIEGYMNFYNYGLLIDADGTFFNGISGWSYQNMGGTGTWKTGIIELGTVGDINLDFNTVTLEYTTAGTYNHRGDVMDGTITFTNTSGGAVTTEIDATVTYVNSGPSITVDAVAVSLTVNSTESGSDIKIFETGTQTIEAQATGTSALTTTTGTYDITVMKAGFLPQRQTGVALGGTNVTVNITLIPDPVYDSGHGLTYTTDYAYNRTTRVLTIVAAQQGRSIYSALIDDFISESSLDNTPFPLLAIGIDRIDFTSDGTTASTIDSGDVQYWQGAGMEWEHATSGAITHKYCSIVGTGTNAAGTKGFYQQVDGASPTSMTLVSNNVNQVIQYYSDPNGDGSTADGYDYSDHLVVKLFNDGYYQKESNILTAYSVSAIESFEYVVPLQMTSTGLGTGDRSITLTLTDNTPAGVEEQTGYTYDYKIEGGASDAPSDLLRQYNYDSYTDPTATLGGVIYFNLPDPIIESGGNYETQRGFVYGQDTTTTYSGFYVEEGTGYHPDFLRQQANDGTYFVTPVFANISISGMSTDGTNIRLQIINSTAVAASSWATGTAYSVGDLVLRTTGTGTENTAGLFMRCTTAGTSHATTEPTWDTTPGNTTTDNTVTWTTYNILYQDGDPVGTSYSDTYTDGNEFLAGETFEVRFVDHNGATSLKDYSTTGIASSTGITVSVSPVTDTVYASNGLDGFAYESVFSPNYLTDYMVLDTNSDYLGTATYAYFKYNLTSSAGMYNFWGGFTAIDEGSYRVNVDVLDMYLDETAGFVKQLDDVRIFRSDGARPALDPTTGGNGIEVNWQVGVRIVETGVSGLTASESSQLANIDSTVTNNLDVPTSKALTTGKFIGLK